MPSSQLADEVVIIFVSLGTFQMHSNSHIIPINNGNTKHNDPRSIYYVKLFTYENYLVLCEQLSRVCFEIITIIFSMETYGETIALIFHQNSVRYRN